MYHELDEEAFIHIATTTVLGSGVAQPDKHPVSVNANAQAAMIRTASPPLTLNYNGQSFGIVKPHK
jgi:hypothetical protein